MIIITIIGITASCIRSCADMEWPLDRGHFCVRGLMAQAMELSIST